MKNNRTPIERLMCGTPRRIEYDPAKRQGTIYMQPDCCTDMTGAIHFFIAIDPKVQSIITIAGGGSRIALAGVS
jgi:hypothetical protein